MAMLTACAYCGDIISAHGYTLEAINAERKPVFIFFDILKDTKKVRNMMKINTRAI